MDDESMVADASYDANPASPKPSVSRGARACTVCRQAKMKCVGAEDDGAKPCQRCRRSNLRCIFEKHRRGRKPGSKLSETAKLLRKLEKGSNTQKVSIKAPPHDDPPLDAPREPIHVPPPPPTPTTSQNVNPFPTLTSPYSAHPRPHHHHHHHSPPPSPMGQDGDDDDNDDLTTDSDRDNDTEAQHIYPAAILERENRKNNYFNTVLGGRDTAKGAPGAHARRPSISRKPGESPDHPPHHLRVPSSRPFPPRYAITLPPLQDPVEAGIITLAQVNGIFDHLFRHLNPFINLFDPQLHTPTYVRERCPFLYTILIMAGCKFWKQEKFRAIQKLVEEFCLRSFVEGPKCVELVQAYMCMTYWKEPDDTRTWMFIGCAARLAVELGLNAYPMSHPSETEQQWLERRNRERTYLVLWVHDRSLSMQTGREWMLPETDIIRMADTWHLMSRLLPVDVVVAAQVGLRRCAAEVTDMFYLRWGGRPPADVNYDVLLRCANYRLQTWADTWMETMDKFHGGDFHKALLNFFKLHVRLFLNSIGLFTPQPSISAVTVCYTSAVETLCLVANEFTKLDMLRYGQDSVSVMTAYSAVSLLKLLRNWPELNAITNVYDIINSTAQAYETASKSMIATSSHTIEYHGRFLRALVVKDQSTRAKSRKKEPSGSSSTQSSNGEDAGTGTGGGGGLPGFAGGTPMANLVGNVPEMLVINDVGRVTKMKVGKVPLAQGMGFGVGAPPLPPPPPPPQVKQQMVSPPLGVQVPQSQQQQKGQQVPHDQSSGNGPSGVVNGTQSGQHHQQQWQHSHHQQQAMTAMYHHAAHRPGPVPHSTSAPHPGSKTLVHPPMAPPPQHQGHVTQQYHLQHQQLMHYQQHQLQGPYGGGGATPWSFPPSPVLPSHPLISPQSEIPSLDLQGGGGGFESANHRVGTLGLGGPGGHHHPSASSSTNVVMEPGQGPLAPQSVQGAGGSSYANGSGSGGGQPAPGSLQMDIDGESPGEGMGGGEAGVIGGGRAAPFFQSLENQNMDVAYWYAMHAELGYGSGTMSLMTGMPRSQTPHPTFHIGPQAQQQSYRDSDGYPETHSAPYPPSNHPPPPGRGQRGGGQQQHPYLPSG